MARNLSATALESILAQHTDEEWVILLTLDHPDMADGPIRVARRREVLISRGHEFVAFPFDVHLPGQSDEQLPTVQLQIDNVDRRIVQAVREIRTAPTVLLEVVIASQPDIVEFTSDQFTLANVSYNAQVVSGTLSYEAFLDEPFPGDLITPDAFPGGF